MWHGGRNSASANPELSSGWAQGVSLVGVPLSCSACETPPHHHLILDCKELGLDFFFLNLQKYLILPLVTCAKLLITKYVLPTFLK